MTRTNENAPLWCAMGLAATVFAGCSSVPGPEASGTTPQPALDAAETSSIAKIEVAPVAAQTPPAVATSAPNHDEKLLDVNAITRLMTKNPRTLWHGDSRSYSYFAGTVVQADYQPDLRKFSVATANRDGDNVACEYDLDGKLLKVESRTEQPEASSESMCRELATLLVTQLKPD